MRNTMLASNGSNKRKPSRKLAGKGTALLLVGCLFMYPGCSGDFLGLEDYQRDLITFGAVALGLLSPNDVGTQGPQGEQGPQGVPGDPGPPGQSTPGDPGIPGEDGISCWDQNENGFQDEFEDVNGDGFVDLLDCQGPQGEQGAQGDQGAQGEQGTQGEQGAQGEQGDTGSQGPQGEQGPAGQDGADGADGAQGPAGPTLFDTFIDDFFTVEGGSYGALNLDPGDSLPIVPIREPALGSCGGDPDSVGVVGYRVALSERYNAGNPVTMRLFVWRQGPVPENCFVFRLDAFRASHGSPITRYGDGPRFIRPIVPDLSEAELQAGIMLVIDLPLNVPLGDGLGFPNDLNAADLLAFELNTLSQWQDGGCYTLLGADFFESTDSASSQNVIIFEDETGDDGIMCEICTNCCKTDDDCDHDGDPCNGEEECIGGFCQPVQFEDCDDDGTPDECEDPNDCVPPSAAAQGGSASGNGGGIVFLSGDDADDTNHCQGVACGGLFPDILSFAVENTQTGPGAPGLICAVGVNGGVALTTLQGADGNGGWNNTGDVDHPGPDADILLLTSENDILNFDLSACSVVYIPSSENHTNGGITVQQLGLLGSRQLEIQSFINDLSGALVALSEAQIANAYDWLPLPIVTANEEHFNAIVTPELVALIPGITDEDVSRENVGGSAPRYHSIFTGPPGFLGMDVLIREADSTDDGTGEVLMLGGFVVLQGELSLNPPTATNFLPQDDTHTVTATLIGSVDPFDPIVGATISFEVTAGPNAGEMGEGVTDVNGEAAFSYTSNSVIGVDIIVAEWVDGDVTSIEVFKTWLPCHCEGAVECTSDADCDDSDSCTIDSCVGGTCSNTAVDCDDELFCTGTETCNSGTGACESSGDPCDVGETCDEENDMCIGAPECADDLDCDDGEFCNGEETCDVPSGTCQPGKDPCAAEDTCDEDGDVCIPPTTDSNCCIARDVPGCDVESCEDAVCGIDPFCCASEWDSQCVTEAVAVCGDLCEAPPTSENDECVDALDIFDGDTEFDNTKATTDGPGNPDCQFDGQTYQDIWYDYVATCTGELTVSTCNQATFDTDLVVYDGCDCPVSNDNMLGCNDDGIGCGGFTSELAVPVVADSCYKVRVGGFDIGDIGTGTVTITCTE